MQEYTWTQLLKNSPEWVGVLASSLFALVTALIIWRQKHVMERQVDVTRELGEAANRILRHQVETMQRQGEISARHERMQNVLLRLQHEHDWTTSYNLKREELFRIATKLHLSILGLIAEPPFDVRSKWSDFLDLRTEMGFQLEVMDAAAFTTEPEGWYAQLRNWNTELFKIMAEHFKTSPGEGYPSETTRASLKASEDKLKPVRAIFLLRKALRDSTEEFKKKWERETA